MEDSVRWTVKVSKETDVALRTFLAQAGMRRGDLSKFIEEAVRWRVLEQTASPIKARASTVGSEELQALIDGAVANVRATLQSRTKPARASRTKRSSPSSGRSRAKR
jgi:hypothetical protein